MANNKTIHVRCLDCNTIVELEKGFFGWKNERCPKCGKKVSYKMEGQQVVTCAKCGNDVLFDAAKGKDNVCPVCGDFLLGSVQKARFHELPCPRCGVVQRVNIPEEKQEVFEKIQQKKKGLFSKETEPVNAAPKPVKSAEPKPWKHVCKACGENFDVEDALYRQNAGEGSKAYVIRYGGQPGDIIWKHPLSKFPFKSQLIVNEGQFALLMKNGVCEYPAGPGSYMLEDSPLSTDQKLDQASLNNDDIVFSTDVFFVQSRITGSFKWGTANPITVGYDQGRIEIEHGGAVNNFGKGAVNVWDTDGKTAAKLQMFGNLSVTVCEPKQFAGWLGYTKITQKELTENKDSMLCRLVRDEVNNVFNEALPNMINQNRWNPDQLRNNLGPIREFVRMAATDALSNYGLAVESFNVESFNITEDEKSKEKREGKDLLRRRVENYITWEVADIPVHMRGNTAQSAKLTAGGTFTVRINDMAKLLSLPEAKEWSDKGASDLLAKNYITRLANDLMRGVFDDVLQPMVDETDADIRELNRYFGYLRKTLNEYLQQAFASRGLYVEDFTIRQNALVESPALAKRSNLTNFREETAIDEEMRRFTQNLKVTQASEGSQHRISLTTIVARESVEMDRIDLQLAQNKEDNADAYAELERRRMLREQGLFNLDADLKHERIMKDIDRSTEVSMHRMNSDNALDTRKDTIASEKKTRWFDEMYADWKRNNALQEEKQKAAIDQKRVSAEARREEEIADQEHRRMLKDIVRKIEESNFDWQQKLDAYDRLCRNNRVRDAIENDVLSAKGSADQEYALGHVKKILKTEEYELLERGRQDVEDREERKNRADFARDMEMRKFAVGVNMEVLRMEVESQRMKDEADERDRSQQAEIAKLQLMLRYLTSKDQQSAGVEIARTNLEAARAMAEKEYAEKKEREERWEERRRQEAREKREDQYADRAERLLHDMWGIQESMQTLKLENEREYNKGRATVDNTFAEYMAKRMDGDKMDELLKYVKKLTKDQKQDAKTPEKKLGDTITVTIDGLDKLLKGSLEGLGLEASDQKKTVKTEPKKESSWISYSGTQPGVGGSGSVCSNCGHPIGKYDSYCPQCGKRM